ncbi:amino acid ABC transporter permease [Hydrogenibacillus schlegelii]|uniref:Glutamine transport system permease protein GlnP n=1 Tax=Hydrogenibacillus schlegelii TaxID=1484 RepID=A0A2T5G9L6_HYDSH|nr:MULTISPECIES: amino acid ABC transporter permease [Hydrogenibacillus]PTQ52883.1 MAG: Glutamine transport system permease protein GlnP [Hydrogenibacillus schlegelii]
MLDLLDFRPEIIWNYRELFIRGVYYTFILSVAGVAIGLVIGLFAGMAKLSRRAWLRVPAVVYIEFFRGTPLFVQILLIHFAVLPTLLGKAQSPIVSGIVALAVNSGAYIAEIFRAGIQSIARGQMEAARSLGLSHAQAMRYVILPQALRRMIPPLGNEFLIVLKDSSLLSAIAVPELANAGRIVNGALQRPWEAFLTVLVLYLILSLVLSALIHRLEGRLSAGRSG